MKRLQIIVILILTFSFLSFAQNENGNDSGERKYHAFSNTLRFGALAGVSIGKTDYNDIRPDVIGRAELEYYLPTTSTGSLSFRGFFTAGYVGGKDVNANPKVFRTTLTRIGGGVSYTLSIKQTVFPYVFAGASYGWFTPRNEQDEELPYNANTGVYEKKEVNYHAEVGTHFLLSDEISLNLNVGAEFSPNDYWDNYVAAGNNDLLIHIMAGLSYSFLTKTDSDNDGVPDDIDQCENTPANVTVDEFGCPIDSDNDGVPDYLDKCPNTKAGFEVDEDGCVIDSDQDGVPDRMDKCPNTPAGMQVNEVGCPDSDNDGVADNLDKCPDTPEGAAVDDTGCPKDSDGDGVPDYKDECPNTPEGMQVDEKGCAKEVVEIIEKMVLEGDTNFEFNKANLLTSAYDQLNKMIESMKDAPDSRWRVEGHTDAIGSESYNMDLSRRRAESVVNYFVQQGIDRSRFEIVPMGESDPVATNDTPEGRAMNRRVEIEIIEK